MKTSDNWKGKVNGPFVGSIPFESKRLQHVQSQFFLRKKDRDKGSKEELRGKSPRALITQLPHSNSEVSLSLCHSAVGHWIFVHSLHFV